MKEHWERKESGGAVADRSVAQRATSSRKIELEITAIDGMPRTGYILLLNGLTSKWKK